MLKGINVILSTRATAGGLTGVAVGEGEVTVSPRPDMEMLPRRRVIESRLTFSAGASAAAPGEKRR